MIGFCSTSGFEPREEPYGGRTLALKQLERLAEQASYAQRHDYPAYATSRLSAHLKFGVLSVREAYGAIQRELGALSPLIRQLSLARFFTYVAYHAPKVLQENLITKNTKSLVGIMTALNLLLGMCRYDRVSNC